MFTARAAALTGHADMVTVYGTILTNNVTRIKALNDRHYETGMNVLTKEKKPGLVIKTFSVAVVLESLHNCLNHKNYRYKKCERLKSVLSGIF